MKRIGILALAIMMLTACSQDEEQIALNGSPVEEETVTMTFSPYQMEAMTRTAVSIAEVVNHLDVWIYEGGSEVAAIHQTTSDADFGGVSVTLDKTKTYTLMSSSRRCLARRQSI